jgi:hypothetical protein
MHHPSVPPSLATALRAAGFRGVVVVERLDGQPLSPAEETLARAIVEMHEQDVSNAELGALVRKALAAKDAPPLAATGTGGE